MGAWVGAALLFGTVTGVLQAEDWPQWRGKGRLGVWNETGIVDKFPPGGLPVVWRTPIQRGYAGPAVADGRVFLTDSRRTTANKAIERALALDEQTGKILWTKEWETDYTGLQLVFAIGPRATPTVDGDRVYVLGRWGSSSRWMCRPAGCCGKRTTSRTSTPRSRHGGWPALRWSTATG